jgi:hypothetical protein
MKTRMRIFSLISSLIAVVLLGSMIDRVNPEGDHVSYLVLAPHPTLDFEHFGGEEGSWRRAHPNETEPWWLVGHYLILMEITDS